MNFVILLKIFSKAELPIIILPTGIKIPLLCQEYRVVLAASYLFNFHTLKKLYFNWEGLMLIVANTELPIGIIAPAIIDLSMGLHKTVHPTRPDILDMLDPNILETPDIELLFVSW